MVNRSTKLRWRRRVRKKQKQVEGLGTEAERQLERNLFRRLNRFVGVRRFVFSWVLLVLFLASGLVLQTRGLSRFYQTLQPAPGGVYTEGIHGAFTNANPLYATSSVDMSAARLVFSSLMKYDSNNKLVGDLAESIDVDDTGSEYTIVLKNNVYWHDGEPLTAKDVVFTYQTIQKPDARSPLLVNWKDVEVSAKSTNTVVFKLPHGLASFPHSLTNGIVPHHLLAGIDATSLRSASFNTVSPVGSGPFKWSAIQVEGDNPKDREERIGLTANKGYYEGPPNLERFIIRAIHDPEKLVQEIESGEISAAAGLNQTSPEIQRSLGLTEHNVPLAGEVVLFMKTGAELLADRQIRQALTMATDRTEVLTDLGYPVAVADSPLLKSHVGYDPNHTQYEYDPARAEKLLDKLGWKKSAEGTRVKKDRTLSVTITTQDSGQYPKIAERIAAGWKTIGVDATVSAQGDDALQGSIAGHGYSILLYGITTGSDPDVYAYWYSSQADPRSANRLNFSEYKSSTADAALEAGRSRLGDNLRAAKYLPFLKAWRVDAPAVVFYQPSYLYVTQASLSGFEPTIFNTPADRFANVENWAVRHDKVDIY